MRYALRRTQKQVDETKKASNKYLEMDYRELQAEAVSRGLNGRQSKEALIKELSQ